MEFENRSGLQALLTRGELPGRNRLMAVVVAKACADLGEGGRFELNLAQAVPVAVEPVKHPLGVIPSDIVICKQGLDVIALGRAYHPEDEGGGASRISVQVDAEERQLCVFGERRWYKNADGVWAISEPEPFSLMDLTWEHSYGGTSFDEWGNDMPHVLNAEGKGFISSEMAIDGTALPNVEDAEHLIQGWQDQPRPCNIAPAPKHIAFDPAPYKEQLEGARKDPFRVPDSMWNDAVPKFQFAAPQPGAEVRLTGMSEQPLRFVLPGLTLQLDVQIGPRRNSLPLALDTLLFLPEQRRCVLTWRRNLIYEFVPRQTRRIVLGRHE